MVKSMKHKVLRKEPVVYSAGRYIGRGQEKGEKQDAHLFNIL